MIGVSTGSVVATRGHLIEAVMPAMCVGSGVRIVPRAGRAVPARVVAVDRHVALLAPFCGITGIAVGDRVEGDPTALATPAATAALGRAIDALGSPLDGGPALRPALVRAPEGARGPVERQAVHAVFATGIRAIDGPLAFGVGARIGLFGAPGCGKSTLLETIVTGSSADATVVGLIGERGREAERWIAGRSSSTTIVCATSDRSAVERVRAAEVAFAQAEALSRRGLHVLLVLDSLARVAGAARDIALAAGEPVGRGGYPPSVFGLLATLLERAGNFMTGSITLVATVLSDGVDGRDPVSEACRAALDGHIVLSERLARQGWFPAIDVPASASRTISDVATAAHATAARRLREWVAVLDETREARSFGLDARDGDPVLRQAIDNEPAIARFLRRTEPSDFGDTLNHLIALTEERTNERFC